MPQRLREIAAKKHGACLEQALANHHEPVYLSNLEAVIKKLGHEVKIKPETDSLRVWFLRPGKDGGMTISPKAKRFKITEVLAEVARLRDGKIHGLESPTQTISAPTPPQQKTSAIDHLSDEEIERLIGEEVRKWNPAATAAGTTRPAKSWPVISV